MQRKHGQYLGPRGNKTAKYGTQQCAIHIGVVGFESETHAKHVFSLLPHVRDLQFKAEMCHFQKLLSFWAVSE